MAKRSGTGTKTDTPLKDIPQTIHVVTQDEIKARGSQTVTEALRYTPAITGGGRVRPPPGDADHTRPPHRPPRR
ncbi:hypothetical protein PDB2_05748 [Pseudomonas aeruginosa]